MRQLFIQVKSVKSKQLQVKHGAFVSHQTPSYKGFQNDLFNIFNSNRKINELIHIKNEKGERVIKHINKRQPLNGHLTSDRDIQMQ